MQHLYLLSGLGADRRVFKFLDLSDFEIHHINWVDPELNETIEQYARRLTAQIGHAQPVLIGVSFGGMMAIEISKLIETDKIILLSSAKTRFDLPNSYKGSQSRLHRLVPVSFYKWVNLVTYWIFGAQTAVERTLLRSIIKDTDPKFLVWAIDKILTWRNEFAPSNVIHIHGNRDRILPLRSADFVIDGGTHLMVVSKAQEVSKIIHQVLL